MAYDRLKPEQIFNIVQTLPESLRSKTITFTVDGSNSAITTGLKGYIICPYSATINSWNLIADTVGSCEIDIWKNTSIPNGANSITASSRPSLSSQQINSDEILSGWTTNISEGDILAFNIVSSSIITQVTLTIKITIDI